MDIREVLRNLVTAVELAEVDEVFVRKEMKAARAALAFLPAEAQGDGAVAWDRCDACNGTLDDHYAPDGGGCPGFRKQVSTETDAEERERLRLAGISTAALGYWKEGDTIHPDYDTPALRDVAKLYAKYDELFQAAAPPAVKVPSEFVLVPLKMTEEMRSASLHAEAPNGDLMQAEWDAMLAAAPSPDQKGGGT